MSFDLQKIDAPECPHCGCNDTSEVRPGRCECNHCGRNFGYQAEASKSIKYVERRTPICPVHNVLMNKNKGASHLPPVTMRKLYFKCPHCERTAPGTEKTI